MISNNITIESTLEWAKSLSDEQLFLLIEDLNTISDERRKIISRHNKQCLSYSNKRNFCCPKCGFPVVKNGKRKDGAQIYRCKNPDCLHQFVPTSGTSFSASKITDEKIKQIITLILLGCPVWVVAWIADTTAKTVAFWRDRCLDAAIDWANETTLCDHVWFDEMVFAPNRTEDPADGRKWKINSTTGRLRKEIQVVIAFDEHGYGFAKRLQKSGHAGFKEIKQAMEGKIREKTILTHDAAYSHNCLFEDNGLGFINDAIKANQGDKDYMRKMGPLNNLCAYLRFEYTKHKGIKTEKLEHYIDFFMYRYFHVRKNGLEMTMEHLFKRISGTQKSHNYRESFKKTVKW